ncbi:Bifunctional inhibitor/plant lipid transfer protein/seed storage helical domain [Arabidopsis suecica]|uniref:Bifunctional inhibitor/plant lipid transfer protein/seed storage helical domain n=1 Tax=Arabidopsis suecica TaxID=45249 RepID=A0A8T1ZWR8_ARASU|nr:Bifunctional inhibitor/plant lipid transfer protein/seed storage helical domain [Arabidopsis suecica]
MKFTTLVCITFIVVLVSFLAPINSVIQACDKIEITGCIPAILYGDKPTPECCGKMKAQQPCFCDFIKNPVFNKYVTSPQARAILKFCGIPYPTC